MKKLFFTVPMACAFLLLTITSNLLAEGNENGSVTDDKSANWKGYSEAKRTLVPDSFNLDLSAESNETGTVIFEFRINHKMVYIDCCKYKDNKYSWCDVELQDHRC